MNPDSSRNRRASMVMRRCFGWRGIVFAALLAAPILASAALGAEADVIVAADGTGRYKTIREAIDAAPQIARDDGRRWRIAVKRGIYRETVYVQREKRFITLIGEDPENTVLSYDLYAGLPGPDDRPISMFRTPTLTVDADDFTMEGLTVENVAGQKSQAIALRVDGDRVVFKKCHFFGWQSTVLVNRGRHFFSECVIRGAVDFIVGGATAYFERCEIQCLGNGFITAASTPDVQRHGLVFSFCKIGGHTPEIRTYLGRPWRDYAKAVFLNTEMSEVVQPAGWDNGKRPRAEGTAFFAEHNNTGPGASADGRVPWAKQLSSADAANFSLENVLGGTDGWNPLREPPPPPARKKKKKQR